MTWRGRTGSVTMKALLSRGAPPGVVVLALGGNGAAGAFQGRRWHRPVGPDQPGPPGRRPGSAAVEQLPRKRRDRTGGAHGGTGIHLTCERPQPGSGLSAGPEER